MTEDAVKFFVRKLKDNKAPGEDGILSELIKSGGEALLERIHLLIQTV